MLFHANSLLQMICMKCQILFSGENKKNLNNLLSAELAKRVVKIYFKQVVDSNTVSIKSKSDSIFSVFSGDIVNDVLY